MSNKESDLLFCETFENMLSRYGYKGKIGKELDRDYLKEWTGDRINLLRKQADWFELLNNLAEMYLKIQNS